MKMNRTIRLIAICLFMILADQIIKVTISRFFYNARFVIIPEFISFHPVQNLKQSWFGSLGVTLFANAAFAIAFNCFAAFISCRAYTYIFVERRSKSKLAFVTFVFLFSGIACSLIDKVFWGGSIDYIRLEGFFTFDLKDCYITAFEIFVCISIAVHYKYFKELKTKDFLKYCFLNLFKKETF